jgi:hypothetical protein
MTNQDRQDYLDFTYFLGEGRQEKKLNEYLRCCQYPPSIIEYALYLVGDAEFVKREFIIWSR